MSDYRMYADVETSRRKHLHHIMDETDTVCWSGKGLLAAFDFLAEKGVYEFRLEGHDEQRGFQVMIHRD